MITKGLFTSERQNWKTPKAFYQALDAEFDFDFDPCPSERERETGSGLHGKNATSSTHRTNILPSG